MNDTHVAQRIINLANEYKNRIIALYDVANQLRSNFRYHKVKLDEGATSYNAMNYSTYRITLEISKSSDIPGFSEISNATIDLSSNITKYKSGSTYIGVSPDSNGFKVITLYDDPELATISTGKLFAIIMICWGSDCSLLHLARVSSKTSGFFL